jgi:acyl-coenzyme A thioesterase PaaI-like protein
MDQSLAEHESTMLRLGWIPEPPEGFIGLVGPIWRSPDVVGHFRLLTAPKHQNRNGVVHGGMLMTLADRAMGYTARAAI